MKAVKLWKDHSLVCDHCGADLLNPEPHGIYVLDLSERVDFAYACCKGKCDQALQHKYGKNTGWQDLSDLTVPIIWLQRWMAVVNGMALNNEAYERAAYERIRNIFVALFPFVIRELSEADRERVEVHYQTIGL